MKLIVLLVTIILSACSQVDKPVELSVDHSVVPKRELSDIAQENYRYEFCQNLDTALQHPALINTLLLGDSLGANEIMKLVRGLPKLKNLSSLWIYSQESLDLEPVFEALQSSDSLRELVIKKCTIRFTGKITALKQLRSIRIENDAMKIPLEILNSLSLKSFSIGNYNTPFCFTGKLKPNNSLQELEIKGGSEENLNVELYKLKNLKTLSITYSALKFISNDVKRLKNLKNLKIESCPLSKNQEAMAKLRSQVNEKCAILTERDIKLNYL